MKIKKAFQAAITTMVLAFAFVMPVLAGTVTVGASAPSAITNGVNGTKPDGASTDINALLNNIANILLFVVGAAAVILIIVGGIRYVTSGGDQSQITGAKNTILYAVIGLVVAAMAYAIVSFVTKNI